MLNTVSKSRMFWFLMSLVLLILLIPFASKTDMRAAAIRFGWDVQQFSEHQIDALAVLLYARATIRSGE